MLTDEPNPLFWSVRRKWAYHMNMAEKLIDTKPELAHIWLQGADLLQKQMDSGVSDHDHDS
jgi:hypothetical protein